MESFPPHMVFRRDLLDLRLASWNVLLQRWASLQLRQGIDEFRWNLHASGIFSRDSMYRVLIHPGMPFDNNNKNRKMKIPLKIKIFAWFLRRGVILTKDTLVKRN
jgi:hypothetical protein